MKLKVVIISILTIAIVSGNLFLMYSCSTAPSGPPPKQSNDWKPPTGGALHTDFDKLLTKYVKDEMVDYAGLKKDEEQLDKYLTAINNTNPSSLPGKEELAYWINAYNAFTLKLILKYYPVNSIKDIPDFPVAKRWKAKVWAAGGKWWSLDEIEHEVLRRKFAEPRVHFAINCASKSCPNISSNAYIPEKLDEQLDKAVKQFLSDTVKGLNIEGSKLKLSQIFSWFKGDFEKKEGSVVNFIRKHAPSHIASRIKDNAEIEFMDYDWSLNGK